MDALKIFLGICLVSLLYDVTSAEKLDIVRYFKVEHVEKEEQRQQFQEIKPVAAEADAENVIPEPVVTSPKDAVYKLSYAEYEMTWKKFKQDHNRKYKSASEERERFANFMDNVKTIERHNWQFHNGRTTYWMDINQFSDWTTEERLAYLSPMKFNESSGFGEHQPVKLDVKNLTAPSNIDWRNQGYVTPVKNQGQCGSCWAFSTTGVLEGQWFRKTRQLISLSEQQLVDCSSGFGNQGCNGGWPYWSYSYIKSTNGVESEADYPYTARQGTCSYKPAKARASDTGYVSVSPQGSEVALQNAVATVGPISVAIYASNNFMNYRGGVFVDNACTSSVNHAVLVVGYNWGSSPYWIVKNSWTTGWGIGGYIYMAANRNNMCQIASYATYPTV